MNGFLVGQLEKVNQGGLVFCYDPIWLSTPGARPISLSLPLTTKPISGNRVYNFFDNLLPDSSDIRTRIQQRFTIPSNHPFDILNYIGKDCVGALQFSEHPLNKPQNIQAHPLREQEIANILRGYKQYPLGMHDAC